MAERVVSLALLSVLSASSAVQGQSYDLAFSTIIGGPNSEEAYGLEIDSKGYVVVHGRGARSSPVTSGVYQEQFKGCGGDAVRILTVACLLRATS
jgi:hypothetical protein